MATIERSKVREMLEQAPPEKRQAILARLQERGFEITEEPDMASRILQVGKEAWESKLPIGEKPLTQAKQAIETVADITARGYEALGMPRLAMVQRKAGEFASGMVPLRVKDAVFIAAAGPALRRISWAARPVTRPAANMLADLAGMVAGKSPEVIKQLFQRPGALWKKASEVFGLKHQENLVRSIDEAMSKVGNGFRSIENKLAKFGTGEKTPIVQLKTAADDTVNEMLKRGHKIPYELSGKKPLAIGRISENSPEYKEISDMLWFMRKNPKLSFGEGLNLRRRLDKLIDYGVEGASGLQPVSPEANTVLMFMRRRVNSSIRTAVPSNLKNAWDRGNFAYNKASQALAGLRKNVIGQSPRQTETKLMQLIKEGRYEDEVLSRAEKIGSIAIKALDDVADHLTGRQFKEWVTGRSGGLNIIPAFPRLTGTVISGAGAATQAVTGNPALTAAAILSARNREGQQ